MTASAIRASSGLKNTGNEIMITTDLDLPWHGQESHVATITTLSSLLDSETLLNKQILRKLSL